MKGAYHHQVGTSAGVLQKFQQEINSWALGEDFSLPRDDLNAAVKFVSQETQSMSG